MGIKFSNNASSNIIHALAADAASVSVTPGTGDLFPSLIEGDYFYATLAGNNGLEIVKVTNRVNDTMTIVRAQDNTTALSFDMGDLFELRIVAADFEDTFSHVESTLEDTVDALNSSVDNKMSSYLSLSGGTMTGPLSFNSTGIEHANYIELWGDPGTNNGGFIDFHYNGEFSDHTSRIIEDKKGKLLIIAPEGLLLNSKDVLTSAGGKITGELDLSGFFCNATSHNDPSIGAANSAGFGGKMYFFPNDHATFPGAVLIDTGDIGGVPGTRLSLSRDQLTWGNSLVLTAAGGTMTGPLSMNKNFLDVTSGGNSSLGAKNDAGEGAKAYFFPNDYPNLGGAFLLDTGLIDGVYHRLRGQGANLTWDGSSILTTANSATIAGYALPSSRYVDLTLGASGSNYTAPANGYFDFRVGAVNDEFIKMRGQGLEVICPCGSSKGVAAAFLPVRAGESVNIEYKYSGQLYRFRFVYAEGVN